jgi:hypothetical protein
VTNSCYDQAAAAANYRHCFFFFFQQEEKEQGSTIVLPGATFSKIVMGENDLRHLLLRR